MFDIITKFAAISNNTQKPWAVGGDNVKETNVNATGQGDLWGNVQSIINAIIGALGIVAVVIIIIGGVNYMTSSGDAGKVKKAKDTILYGVIGLVVCVLAFAIVNFVISNILG